MTPKTVSAFRISRTLTSGSSDHLSPFAMWRAFPTSDYYGDSVTLGLAHREAIPRSVGVERIERDLGVPLIPLNEVVLHRPTGRRWPIAKL